MTYTHGHDESVLRSHKWRTVDNSAAYLAAHLTPGTTVLDLGCGPGTITADIGARVAPGHVLGIDASADVVADAQRGAGAGANVEFAVGDIYALDIADETFDVVHAHQVLQHLPDPVSALREMKRVCKPGGFVAARDSDYAAFRWYPDEPAIERWLALYATSRAATPASPTQDGSCSRGRTPRVSPTCSREHRCGASRRPTTAPGGAGSGPIA